MRRIDGLDAFEAPPGGTVLTIGNFDGVHLGHQHLLRTVRALAGERDATGVAITFDPHPIAILAPQQTPERLTTLDERLYLMEHFGSEFVIVLRTDRVLLSQTAEEFLGRLADRCRPRAIVEGPDFHFGRGRRGDVETLRAHASELGYELCVVAPARCEALPGAPIVNSSAVRRALLDGDVAAAHAMLGRPYRIRGTVVRGDGRGGPIGFPTANLSGVPHMLPAAGVYACAAQLESGAMRAAAVNIGGQPTFGSENLRIEAHLLDYSGDLLGQRLGVHLLSRLRGQIRFPGVEALVEQLRRDAAATRELVSAAGEPGFLPRAPF
jgi:riboflavin kinase/FMN adenylyltransferase